MPGTFNSYQKHFMFLVAEVIYIPNQYTFDTIETKITDNDINLCLKMMLHKIGESKKLSHSWGFLDP